MNGSFVGHRRVRCGWAQHKADSSTADIGSVDQADPQNSNVYVGNIAPEVSDQELRRNFQQFGNVVEVKTYRKGSYGFVHFEVGPSAGPAGCQDCSRSSGASCCHVWCAGQTCLP